MVDGMVWRTAGKSARYAGELVVPSLLMQFGDICHFKTASLYSCRKMFPLLLNGVVYKSYVRSEVLFGGGVC